SEASTVLAPGYKDRPQDACRYELSPEEKREMKGIVKKVLALIFSLLSLVWSLANVSMAFGQKQGVPPTGSKPRAVFAKPTHTRVTDAMHEDLIVVKFREGTHVRARSGRLLAELGNLSPHEEQLLRRANLDHFKIVQEVDLVNELLQTNPSRRFGRLFPRA